MRPPLGNQPAARANRMELLINTKQRKSIYVYAYIQTQAFASAVQNIGIYAEYKELKRIETAFRGVPQITKHINR